MPKERLRVHYSGRVQGVGFRYTAARLAEGYDVTGYVRNLSDGRVELVAEGQSLTVESFLASVKDALGPKIHAAEAAPLPEGEPPYPDFSIRHD
jgi:acylphosphatase